MITEEIKYYINKSVLCWLATSSLELVPNVSPKELFLCYDDEHILVANIASPQTVKNISENPNVCISFIDVLIQKGYQLKGTAEIIKINHADFKTHEAPMLKMTCSKFPISSIIKVKVTKSKPILAPSYIFYPDTREEDQVKNAMEVYGIK